MTYIKDSSMLKYETISDKNFKPLINFVIWFTRKYECSYNGILSLLLDFIFTD